MDPLTVISTVSSVSKVVWGVSQTLYEFIEDTKNINQSVKDLAAEIKSLEEVLKQVDSTVKDPNVEAIANHGTDDAGWLWQSVHGALMECQRTVKRIDSLISTFREDRSNWGAQAVRQVKINLKKDEIASLRQNVFMHTTALNVAIGMVTVRVACSGPSHVVTTLGAKIDDLQDSLAVLTTSLTVTSKGAFRTSENAKEGDLRNTQNLSSLAERYISTAKSTYSETIAAGSVVDHDEILERHQKVLSWIPEAFDGRQSDTTASETTYYGPEPTNTFNLDRNDEVRSTPASQVPSIDSYEDDFDVRLVEEMIKKGAEAYESGSYDDALGKLVASWDLLRKLEIDQRNRINIEEVPMMIGISKYRLNRLEDARAVFLAIIRKPASTDQDAIRICQASHLLSRICFTQFQFKDAEIHCRNALRGRELSLGRSHEDYFASLGLLSAILKGLGKIHEAAALRSMIPCNVASNIPEVRFDRVGWALHVVGQQNLIVQDEKRGCTTLPDPNSFYQAISPDGNFGVSGHSWFSDVSIKDIKTAQSLRHVRHKGNAESEYALSRDNRFLVSVSPTEKLLNIQDLETGVNRTAPWERARVVCFSRDGKHVASGSCFSWPPAVAIWNVKTLAQEHLFRDHSGDFIAVEFSSNGKLLASASESIIRIRHLTTGNTCFEKQCSKGLRLTSLAFSEDNKLIAYSTSRSEVFVWDIWKDQRCGHFENLGSPVDALTFSHDSKLLAAGCQTSIQIWDITTNICYQYMDKKPGRIVGLVFVRILMYSPSDDSDNQTRHGTSASLKVDDFDRAFDAFDARSPPARVSEVNSKPTLAFMGGAERSETQSLHERAMLARLPHQDASKTLHQRIEPRSVKRPSHTSSPNLPQSNTLEETRYEDASPFWRYIVIPVILAPGCILIFSSWYIFMPLMLLLVVMFLLSI